MKPILDKIDLNSKDCLEEIKEIILSEPELLLQRPEIFSFLIEKKFSSLLTLLNQKSLETPALIDLKNIISLEVPVNIKALYYPILNEFKILNSELDGILSISISDTKKNVLQSLCSQDSDSFQVNLILNPKSLFSYQVEDSKSKETIVDKFLSNKALAFAIASSIVIGTTGGKFTAQKYQDYKMSHVEKKGFFSNYSLAMTELEKLENNSKLFNAINSISSQELDYLTLILDSKDLTEVQHDYKDIIVDKVKDLMTSVQKERVKFKNQKKIQSEEKIFEISQEIVNVSIDHDIDFRILTSIIMQESGFDQGEVSRSGDVTLAQINYEIWKPEFDKMGLDLDKDKLKTDEKYSLWAMGVILSTIKKRHADKDPYWFARYHNKNPKPKFQYVNLVNSHFTSFNKFQRDEVLVKISQVLNEIKIIDFSKNNKVDKSIINKFEKDLLAIKIKLETSDIPSNIASN